MHEIILFLSPDEPDEPDAGAMNYLVNLVNLVIIFQTLFRALRAIRWQNNYLLLNKPLSPESKTYELLKLTNNHGHYITFTYQKSKNPPKITITIYIFRQFSFLPIFKTPRP